MTNEKKSEFYLVREEILPEAIKKTIMVKEILKRGKLKTINEAVAKVGLSRSAYYKYKDYVFPFYDASREKVITISLLLEHKPGVLSSVLNTIAADGEVLSRSTKVFPCRVLPTQPFPWKQNSSPSIWRPFWIRFASSKE